MEIVCIQCLTPLCAAVQALGDPLIDSVVSENIPILTADEKFNETVSSIVRRVEAVLTGKTQAPSHGCQSQALHVLR